jgi:hypothetical protein
MKLWPSHSPTRDLRAQSRTQPKQPSRRQLAGSYCWAHVWASVIIRVKVLAHTNLAYRILVISWSFALRQSAPETLWNQ